MKANLGINEFMERMQSDIAYVDSDSKTHSLIIDLGKCEQWLSRYLKLLKLQSFGAVGIGAVVFALSIFFMSLGVTVKSESICYSIGISALLGVLFFVVVAAIWHEVIINRASFLQPIIKAIKLPAVFVDNPKRYLRLLCKIDNELASNNRDYRYLVEPEFYGWAKKELLLPKEHLLVLCHLYILHFYSNLFSTTFKGECITMAYFVGYTCSNCVSE